MTTRATAAVQAEAEVASVKQYGMSNNFLLSTGVCPFGIVGHPALCKEQYQAAEISCSGGFSQPPRECQCGACNHPKQSPLNNSRSDLHLI
jgi:hypothetical protein